MRDTGGVVDAEQSSTLQLVMDQVEELIVTLIEEIRERPGVAAAIVAAVAGVVVGSWFAARTRSQGKPRKRAAKAAKRAFGAADMARIGVRLLENPLVRGMLVAQVKRRLLSTR